jgi:regulatory protein
VAISRRFGARASKGPTAEERVDPAATRSAAIALLARRDYASCELRSRLERKGFDPTLIETTLQELTHEHVVDDARYAANYVGYHAQRGEGPVRIAGDLKALGLPDGLVDAAVAGGPDWCALARGVRLRKFGAESPTQWAEKARQARFLQYRGFSSDHIRSALDADFDLD